MDSHSSRGGKAKATKRKIPEENVKGKKAATRSSTSSQGGKADAKKRRVLFEDVKDKKEKKEVECVLIQNKMKRQDWKSLSKFTHLAELYIMDQDLSEGLPPVLHTLNTLKVLSLGRCKIKAIPKSLASLRGLTEFQLFTNDFSEGLPEAVCGLTSLTTLKIYDNKLTDLPDGLSRLTQLKDLDISINNIENVPNCVFTFKNLKKLTIDSEKLKIDKEILSLPHLTKIELKGHQPRVVRGHKDIRKFCEYPGRSSAQSSQHNSGKQIALELEACHLPLQAINRYQNL
ncbi:leucine-rich repeat protein SHOC-2-like [Watersipora subatra]|uniref:leucine-rich repeat protein SHOC-2-like n=1 Tax=Watersipora subatra TaxID=2589382 RepID=UPI00355B5276